MKIKVYETDWEIWKETGINGHGTEIEVPDAIVKEWRELRARLRDIQDYIEEKAVAIDNANREAYLKEQSEKQLAAVEARCQATSHRDIVEWDRVAAAQYGQKIMSQYAMWAGFGDPPRGIVYEDSPLRDKDDDSTKD